MLVYHARRFVGNDALVLLGMVYLFVGLFDLLHTLAYRGMGLFPGFGEANLATQLWVAARYTESLGIFAFAVFLGRPVRQQAAFFVCTAWSSLMLGSIFLWPVFPVCLVTGTGLTPFKIASEISICLILIGSLVMLWRKRTRRDDPVFVPMVGAIVATVASELSFTFYIDVFDLSNLIGHYLKIVSFLLIYLALIRSGLTRPYEALFRDWRETERSFRRLIEVVPISVMEFDHEGVVTHVNPYHLRTFGAGKHSAGYFLGRKIHELPGVVRAGIGDRLARVLHGERVVIADAYFPAFTGGHSGNQRIVAEPLISPTGTVSGGFLLREDTTALRRHERMFARALTTIQDGYWLLDNSGTIRESNVAAAQMLGYPPGGLNGMHVEAIDGAMGSHAASERMETVRRLGHDRFETRHRHRDGRQVAVEVSTSYMDYGDGHFVVFIRDISDRKRDAERLNRSEAKFATAFYRSPMPMVISDIDDETYIDVNDAFVRTTGYLKRDCIGRSASELGIIDPDLRQQLKATLGTQKRVDGVELRMRRKDGCWRIGRYWGEPIIVGGTLRLLSIVHDITEEKRAERERVVTENLLRLINRQSDLDELLHGVVAMLKTWSGCRAVGIRLRVADAFPYAAETGFGEPLDVEPPRLAAELGDVPPCVCQAVLGPPDDARPAGCSPFGSFWTNRASSAGPELEPFRPGPCCMRDGMASVALIPLRYGETVLGLLQFADSRGDIFDTAMIEQLERLAGKLAVAIKARRDVAALQQSEHRYRTLFENAPVGIFTTTTAGRVTAVNPEMARMMGYPSPDAALAARSDLSRQLFADDHRREQFVDQLTAAGRVKGFEYEALDANGVRLWLRMDARMGDPLPDGGTRIEGFAVDVTAGKANEKKLQLQAMVLDQIHDQVVVTDLEGRITYVNDAPLRMLGFSRGEMIGQPITVFGEDPTQGASQREILERTLADGQWHGELINYTKSGERRIMACRTRKITDADGRPIALCGIAEDITRRRHQEHELRRLASAIDQAAESIMITEPDGTIVFVNPSFEKITGYRRDEVIGKKPRILKSGVHDAAFYRDLWDTLSAGRTWTGQITNRRKNGRHYVEKCTISPVIGETGAIINFVAVKNDVTDEMLLEKKLSQAQKMEAIGTLAGGIAHDFNNILFPMVGFTEMLREDLPADSPLQDYVTDVLAAALRARDLVQQILAFSRQAEQERTAIRVQPILNEAVKLARASLPSNIEIALDIDGTCPPILADPTQVHQIIMNLITNAYHAMEPAGGTLTIALGRHAITEHASRQLTPAPGDYVRLAVTDTGKGIDAAILERIFDPYFTTKAEGKGTGLGLSVIHGIVSEYAGDIQVESRPGRGTTFTILLPCLQSAIEKRVSPEKASIQGGNERILLVDDEVAVVNMVKKMLTRLGYAVTACTSSKDALATFRDDPSHFDLVVTDMTMPGMTGDQLTRALKAIRQDIPVVLCTGFSNQIDAAGAARIGAAGFVLKPILKRDIARAIRMALGVDGQGNGRYRATAGRW